ncbi:TIGR02678 family protein [Spongiactinospora gelatinilytica]|uniref:TIGR02678 family protein n=1 Tax=Spongiactinospora gelatinilytica TaxID=2666298 RepID=A0A2W2G748_9ACTN|nr:TIGR02678 family protein [Spongiactinospora gelatinilytica]PZG44121.1 TIGR02678 family protein [Spongiactinospora gelatinilytica]
MTPEEEVAQRRTALRALLARPLLTAERDAEALVLVRRHLTALREWLTRETGWRLTVDSGAARLFKSASDTRDATHPARGRAGEPYGRRRYVVLCLALAMLERADAQTTLGRLAEEVLSAAAEPELDFTFTLDSRAERADLVAVVRMLLDWGVLRRVAGDEEAYLSATGDVLYDVRRPVLAALLTGARGPSTISAGSFEERLAALTAEPIADTDDLRNQALRRGLTRRLLEDPVIYFDDLGEAERAYLASQRHALVRRVEEATGLVAEIRAEGIAMVDPDDELTDVRMPEQRTDGHVTLLVAERLAGRGEATIEELKEFVRQAAHQHTAFWRKGVTDPGAEDGLLATALAKLTALRLVRVEGESAVGLPAIARYALNDPVIKGT